MQEVHLRVSDDLAEHQRQRADSGNVNTVSRDGQRIILLRERAHEHAQRAPRQHRTERKRYAEDMTAAGVSPDDADRTGNRADNADDLLHRHALMQQQHRKEADGDRVHAVDERCQRCSRQLGAVLLQTDGQHIAAQTEHDNVFPVAALDPARLAVRVGLTQALQDGHGNGCDDVAQAQQRERLNHIEQYLACRVQAAPENRGQRKQQAGCFIVLLLLHSLSTPLLCILS